jgi:hypothetical protein
MGCHSTGCLHDSSATVDHLVCLPILAADGSIASKTLRRRYCRPFQKMNILQKRKMNSRLVHAAATEKSTLSSPPSSVEASSRRKLRLSNWRRNRGWGKQSGDCVSEGGTTTTTCETREGNNDDDFFRRFHVTVVKTRTESAQPEPDVLMREGDGPVAKKSVRFHKYDEVWNGGPREFVYSLYDREQQEETERDLADDFDDVVGNVSHFFRCIKEGIEDVTRGGGKKLYQRHRRTPSPPPSTSRSSSEPDDDEEGSYQSYQSYTDDEDEDDSEIFEESSLSTYEHS